MFFCSWKKCGSQEKITVPLVYNVRNVLTGEKEVLKIELKY
jgi:hypothetical protein